MPTCSTILGDLESMEVHRDPECPARYRYPASAGLSRRFGTLSDAMVQGYRPCVCVDREIRPRTVSGS